MIRIICVQLSALKRSPSLGKKTWGASVRVKNDNMPQQIHMLVFCFITVALSVVATLVCLNEKGKVKETL